MSTVLFSKSFIQKINAIIRGFWWARVQDDNPTSPIAFHSWEDIYQTKENGGLGIRDLYTVNKSLLTHAAWDIATNKNPFLSSILKAKYYHNGPFWTTNTNGPRSIFWSSILQVKRIYVPILSTNSMQVIAPFGPIRGVPFGILFKTTCIYRSLLYPFLLLFLNFGFLTLVPGM